MGIYGLTSYVAQHQSQLLDDWKLCDCAVLVDGNSAASLIYSNMTRSNHAFGGDYDAYAHSSRQFVRLLRKCGLTPVFVFDGGYEQRKLKTVLERLRLNAVICGQYKNKFRQSRTFPLVLRDAFRAILRELEATTVQCDFEADTELVVLSRILGCPLISYDSDFCISDAQYIPFTSIDLRAVKKKSRRRYYLPCKRFNVDTFLERFGGPVDKGLLPLLSCALGNDYVPRNTFKKFLQLDHTASFEERISKTVAWVASISCVNDAVDEMVAHVEKNKTKMKMMINHFLVDYNRTASYLLDFIPQEIVDASLCLKLKTMALSNTSVQEESAKGSVVFPLSQSDPDASLLDADEEDASSSSDDDIIVLETEEYEISRSDDDDEPSDSDPLLEKSKYDPEDTLPDVELPDGIKPEADISNCMENTVDLDCTMDDLLLITDAQTNATSSGDTILGSKVPQWFLDKYRLGLITPNLVNVINFQRYFIPSQSEDYFSKPSHEIVLPILEVVVGIVLGKDTAVSKVKCHARLKSMYVGVYDIVPRFELHAQALPDLFNVASMPTEVRASVLADCLGLPKDLNLCIFPQEWRLYMLILMYWRKHCKQPAVNDSHIRAVFMCLIYLGVIDPKIGFARTTVDLKRMKKEKKQCDKLKIRSERSKSDADQLTLTEGAQLSSTEVPLDADQSTHQSDPSLTSDNLARFSKIKGDPVPSNERDNSPIISASSLNVNQSVTLSEVTEDPLPDSNQSIIKCDPLPNQSIDLVSIVGSPRLDTSQSFNLSKDGDSLLDQTAGLSNAIEDPLPAADQVAASDAPPNDASVSTAEDTVNELFGNVSGLDCVQDYLDLILEEDCYKSAQALLSYHQVNQALLKNRKDFDQKLIHSLAQLQHCIQSVGILNSVLDFPFVPCQMHSCFCGTFLYNFYSELNHRKLADGYITRTVLTKATTIIALYRYMISSWEAVTSKKVIRAKFEVKKKKKKVGQLAKVQSCEQPQQQESYQDPDNIYSLLPEE